jgi:hypothetical protein
VTPIKTWTGRVLRATTEVEWSTGRVFYVIDKFGTITLERDMFGTIDDRAGGLCIHYGRYDATASPFDRVLPEAPVVFGVKLQGATTVYLDTMAERKHYYWHACREGGGEAPAGTRKRIHEVCTAVVGHYLERDDFPAIEQARARHLAPARLKLHQERINKLRAELAEREAKLATELAGADVQLSLMTPARRDASAAAA